MADLDFEELDKAVNTLMAGVDSSKRNTALDDPKVKVVSLDAGSDDAKVEAEVPTSTFSEPTTEVSNNDDTTEDVSVDTPAPVVAAPASTLATKRRGQFMDVMHPSSDMKVVSKPLRRTPIVVAPPSDVIAEPTPEDDTDIDDLADSSYSPSVETIQPASEPLSSPFLPDTKPEKRPLGGSVFIADEPDEAPAEDEIIVDAGNDVNATATDTIEQVPDANAALLPEELGSDILAVEANDLVGADSSKDLTAQTPAEEPKPAERAPDQEAMLQEADPIPAAQAVVPAGGSIAQQYDETPSTGDQTNGSIYDTANYHQAITPVEAPVKKASPIKWILLTLLLLVIGSGAGVGYFFLTR